jgi:hypothetical protein
VFPCKEHIIDTGRLMTVDGLTVFTLIFQQLCLTASKFVAHLINQNVVSNYP